MVWKIILGLFVVLMLFQAVGHYSDNAKLEQQQRESARAAAAKQAKIEADKTERANDFTNNRDRILADLRTKAAAKNWTEARATAIQFKDVNDPEYIALAATIHDNWLAAEKKREAAEKKANEKADRDRRKREGVSIGMTRQQVIESKWGRPQSISKTHYSFGTHEQWVYGGHNYLYFENGILKTIQN